MIDPNRLYKEKNLTIEKIDHDSGLVIVLSKNNSRFQGYLDKPKRFNVNDKVDALLFFSIFADNWKVEKLIKKRTKKTVSLKVNQSNVNDKEKQLNSVIVQIDKLMNEIKETSKTISVNSRWSDNRKKHIKEKNTKTLKQYKLTS